jgi:hypothetical protein
MPIKPQPSHKPVVRGAGQALPAAPVRMSVEVVTESQIVKRVVQPAEALPLKPVSPIISVNAAGLMGDRIASPIPTPQNPIKVAPKPVSKAAPPVAPTKFRVEESKEAAQAVMVKPFDRLLKQVALNIAVEDGLVPESRVSRLVESISTTKPFNVFFHRSGHETYWRCPRAYWLNYHYLGTGIYKAPIPLHLEVGSAVHHGFASILLGRDIEYAVTVAQQYLQHGERWPFLNPQYEQQEQLALIAGLLYSFWFYMWPQFQKQFKVLYVERGVVSTEVFDTGDGGKLHAHRMSRPDAILQDRHTNEIVGWSLKTINDLNEWKRQQFHNDLQGLTEMYNAEVMLSQIREAGPDAFVESWLGDVDGKPTYAQIKEKIAEWDTLPTQVDYIQTLFLVKGVRKPFQEAEEAGIIAAYGRGDLDSFDHEEKEFRQHSPLCYMWQNNGEAPIGSPARAWKNTYYKPDNKSYNRLGKGFDRVPVWGDQMAGHRHVKTINIAISDWVQRLNSSEVYPSTLPDDRNIKNPLSTIVVYDEPMYRNRQHMQTVVERQVGQVQTKIAFDLYDIQNALSSGQVDEAQMLVDANFDQHLTSCRQPYRCEFSKLCHETPEGWMDHKTMPEGFAARKPHHDFETEQREGK